MINSFRWSFLILLAGALLSGCAQNDSRQPQVSNRQIPAPKEPPIPPPVQNQRPEPSLQAAARTEINAALSSNDGFVRAHGIEAAQNTLGATEKSIYLTGLKDSAPQARFASAMAIGRLQIVSALPQLEQMIDDSNAQVGLAVRFALHRLGNTTYSKEFETTATDASWPIRATTAQVLGLLGEPTASRILLPMLRDKEDAVRLQAAESLWRLGNTDGLKTLVASVASGYPDDQMVALLGLAGPKDRRVLGHLRGALVTDYTEVSLVAARAVGMCGSDAGYVIAVDGTHSKDPRQRALAALALGAIGRSDAQAVLGDLLKDKESPDVRLSAAQALLQLKAPLASARGD
jgi:HEAT repeat protein